MSTVTPIDASRDEYDEHFGALCAAFDRGYTVDRRAALRTAFVGKLTAAQVARMVERLIGETGPEKMPSTREMWQSWRSMRAPAPRREPDRPQHVWPQWIASANVCLIGCAQRYPGRDSRAGWALARRLADTWQLLAEDHDPAATYDGLKAAMLDEYAKLPEVA